MGDFITIRIAVFQDIDVQRADRLPKVDKGGMRILDTEHGERGPGQDREHRQTISEI